MSYCKLDKCFGFETERGVDIAEVEGRLFTSLKEAKKPSLCLPSYYCIFKMRSVSRP